MVRQLLQRVVYIRITDENGKRKYVELGTISRKGVFRLTNKDLLDTKGMPLPGLFLV